MPEAGDSAQWLAKKLYTCERHTPRLQGVGEQSPALSQRNRDALACRLTIYACIRRQCPGLTTAIIS